MTKISQVELNIGHEKKPLSSLSMKEAKVYLSKIKTDRVKIKALVDGFRTPKQQRDQSSSSAAASDSKH